MKKYLKVFQLYLQELTEYRLNLIGQSLMWFIPLLGFYYVWQAIYSRQGNFGTYSREQMITYYLLVSFLSGMIQSSSYWPISREIGRGELTKYLLRPVSYVIYHFSLNVARRLSRVVILFVSILILKHFLPEFIVLPKSSFFICAFLMSAVLNFIMYYHFAALLGFSAFWLIRTIGFIYSAEMILMFFSGLFIPLDLLPSFFNKISVVFPFRYGLYFSIKIFISDLTFKQVWLGLVCQILWIFILLYSIKIVWKLGLKKYESVGI